jgi:hypothetical protein
MVVEPPMNGFDDELLMINKWCGNQCKYAHLEMKHGTLYRVFCNKNLEWIANEHIGNNKLFNYIMNNCKNYERNGAI